MAPLKFYLYLSFVLVFFIDGCTEQKTNKKTVEEKEDMPVDFKSKGLENLNESRVMKDILCQAWDYKEDVEDAKGSDPGSNLDIVYRGYCFFSDGTAIKDQRGNLQTGKWSMDESVKPITLTLTLDNGEKEVSQLAYLMPYEMILSRLIGSEIKKIDLGSEAIRHINLEDDPFYISNILWRLKPKRAESDQEIKSRLKSCIHFFVLFYNQKINANSETVTFTGLPSCFVWHAGGIFLQKETALQKKWIDCFYNKEQALKAYKLADKLMSKKYTWPKGETNWVKQNVFVLKQMENRIDSL